MTFTKSLLMSLALSAVLTACNNGEDYRVRARFSGAIVGQNVTRAYDSSWEAGDMIGVSGTCGYIQYYNAPYITSDVDGHFTHVSDINKIYFQSADSVTFIAYYPWRSSLKDNCVKTTTADQANQREFDFLYAAGSGAYNTPNVNFLFTHSMSKVNITLKCGVEVDYSDLKAATFVVSGFQESGYFDTTTGVAGTDLTKEVSSVSIDSTNIRTLCDDDSTIDYPLIFFPQTLTPNLSIAVTSGGNTYKAIVNVPSVGESTALNQLVAGYEYDINVVLNKSGISVDGCTISAWNKTDVGDIDAQ